MKERSADKLPSALKNKEKIIGKLKEGKPVICLDYDGTLTPIVDDPAKAHLPDKVRQTQKKLSEYWPEIIMSGRAMEDVRTLVGLDELIYAGSHGFNMRGAHGAFHEEPKKHFLGALDKAEKELRKILKARENIKIERKPYAIALHYRKAGKNIIPGFERQVDEIVGHHPDLKKTTGKKIFELRPKTDWNKGAALLYLLKKIYGDKHNAIPLYIGDDVTDEDAFRAISDGGISVLVSKEDQKTAAAYSIDNPGKVANFLAELLKHAEKNDPEDTLRFSYRDFKPQSEKLREALCSVGNGYFATRGAAPESPAGESHYPGTYIGGLYNRLKSTVKGKTIENESLVNVPNWLPLTFRIEDGEWFDLEKVDILDYRQELDMRRGILTREVRFADKKKRRTTLIQRRFVHMRHKHIAALESRITAENWCGRIRVRSAIDGSVENTLVERYRKLNNHHLEQLGKGATDDHLIWLQAETNQSRIRIVEAARTRIFFEDITINEADRLIRKEGYIGQEFDLKIQAGKSLRIEKIVSLYNSRDLAISESRLEALDALHRAGNFSQLLELHEIAWRHLWQRWGMSMETKSHRIEQVHNLHVFHLLQSASPNTVGLDVGVPPRGLHGEAYRGLIMWDELFIMPLFNLRIPDISRGLLMYRYRRMPRACNAAEKEGCRGAMYPWQSGSNGEEQAQTLHLNPESGRWISDNTQLQRHINIAIAYNIWQYFQVSGDEDFISFYGAELFIKIVRFWTSKAEYNPQLDRYDIRGVMGPDEFHDKYPGAGKPGIDNNAYTNIMVAWILVRALEMLDMLPRNRRKFIMEDLFLTREELAHWDEMSRKLRVVFHGDGIISQFEGYSELKEFDWEHYKKKYGDIQRLDRILEAEGDSPNNYKLSKQADVLMLFYLFSAEELHELFEHLDYPFDSESIPRNIEYYSSRTSHGSTLSRIVHAWLLVRSRRKESWKLFREALESDIEDIQGGTTHEGIHLGAMAGTVDMILRCYSGIVTRANTLWFNPRLPEEISSLNYCIEYRKSRVYVSISSKALKLEIQEDAREAVQIGFHKETFQMQPGEKRELKLR